MSINELPTFGFFDEEAPVFSTRRDTETIELAPLMAELTMSGNFNPTEIEATSLGKLLQALPIPSLLIGPHDRIIFANVAWEQVSCSYENILRRPCHELFPNPSTARMVKSIVQSVFSSRKSQQTMGVLEIDKKQIWGRVHFKSLRMGGEQAVLVLLEDLTAEKKQLLLHQRHQEKLKKEIAIRKSAEAAMKASEQRMRVLIEVSPIGISIVQHGTCVYANAAFREIFAYQNGDSVLDQPIENFIDAKCGQLMSSGPTCDGETEPAAISFECKGLKKSGGKFDITIWQRRILYLGQSSIMIFIADASEAKALRSQLLQAQKMEAIGTLAGGIAHDFNNLLTIIQGYSELILLTKGKNIEANARTILEACRKGADMVQRLLAFSRKVESTLRPLNLNDEIEQFRGLLERMIPKMIHIDLRLAEDLATISGDLTQIEQILMNLASNAKDAMPDGGTLTIETRNVGRGNRLCQSMGTDQPWVMLSVADTGHGIKKEFIDHIFEPFFTTKQIGKGTGLGLSTVYGIVKKHNGHIVCESQSGKGAAFHIFFPVTNEQEQAKQERATQASCKGGNETILLVDDEALVRELGQEFLAEVGYTVLTAPDGQSALEVYLKEAKRISLVILDLVMPQMSGIQCLRKLIEINPRVKVLVASGYAGAGQTEESIKSGATGFIKKPFILADMLAAIRTALDSSRQHSVSTPVCG
ncbi:MAG TPA: response regulator [Desulfomonilaceae bacterium]|nr:response regulator [Desulfomonilaceae bacterium]